MSIQALVRKKVASMRDRVNEAGNDGEQAMMAYNDYSLYFQGAAEALEARGDSEDDIKPVTLAMSMVEAEIAAVVRRGELEAALG